MTIGGSDSGAGAGIQADLKTFTALNVFGTTVVTCVTAQNPASVNGIQQMEPDLVGEQIRTVCDGFPVAAAKTGMLYSAAIIRTVANTIRSLNIPCLIVDPVMVSSSGSRLLREEAVETLMGLFLPMATVITPNIPEAEILCHHPVKNLNDMKAAAESIAREFHCSCVVKGGHLPGNKASDVLYHDGKIEVKTCTKEKAEETHGTGCVFSAAMTSYMALKKPVPEAFRHAKQFVTRAIKRRICTGEHFPLGIDRAG